METLNDQSNFLDGEEVEATNTGSALRIIVASYNLESQYVGFTITNSNSQALSARGRKSGAFLAPDIDYITLANGIKVLWTNTTNSNNGIAAEFYRKKYSVSSWNYVINMSMSAVNPLGNFCYKNNNRIKATVHHNYYNYSVSFYGSSGC